MFLRLSPEVATTLQNRKTWLWIGVFFSKGSLVMIYRFVASHMQQHSLLFYSENNSYVEKRKGLCPSWAGLAANIR